MKEELRGNVRQEEQRVHPEETTEQVMDTRETNPVGAESQDNLDRGEEQHSMGECFLVHTASSRSPLRADTVPIEGVGEVAVEGLMVQPNSLLTALEDDSSQQTMEKWALDNAPPPVKVRREGETFEESSPKELSPPPSPKRMREVARKGKVFSQASI